MPRIFSVPAPACKSDPRSARPPWITARADLLDAVSTYAARAAVKLRHEGQAAGGIQAARSGLNRIFKAGLRHKKAGVTLVELVPRTVRQGALFGLEDELHQERRVRRGNLTPGYTTDWAGLVEGKT